MAMLQDTARVRCLQLLLLVAGCSAFQIGSPGPTARASAHGVGAGAAPGGTFLRPPRRRRASRLSMKRRPAFVDEAERLAALAVETWEVQCTPFYEPGDASIVESAFDGRADVEAFRVAGGGRAPCPSGGDGGAEAGAGPGEGRRSRFVFAHPDLGLDAASAGSGYCSAIRIENLDAMSISVADACASMGVFPESLGDLVVEDSSTAYLIVDPEVATRCIRILPKELPGRGVSLAELGDGEVVPDGTFQEMKLSKLLERELERKKLAKGYVQFG